MKMRLFDMVGCLSSAMDLVSPAVVGHHRRVGCIAYRLSLAAGMPPGVTAELTLAGLVHDVGAFSLQDRLLALAFDADDRSHAEVGYRLLSGFPRFSRVAALVRLHHDPWESSPKVKRRNQPERELANLLSLADRVDTQLPRTLDKAFNRDSLLKRLRSGSGTLFNPVWLQAFEALADDPTFWELLATADKKSVCESMAAEHNPTLKADELRSLARLFAQIIDFRSRFTSTHSMGVAATAMALGRELGMDENDLARLELAGELHDIGKLGVPSEILLKPASLTDDEMRVMRNHAEYSRSVLSGVPGFETVARWASNHHERLDGQGYPHALDADGLDLGSRVMTVADIFTALAEDRPYRAGMTLSQALSIIEDMVQSGALDPDVAQAFSRNLPVIDEARRQAQNQARQNFDRFAMASDDED